ncbi:MAG: phosphotransferase [Anaerolineales bacterium]|nr:phosphotransferase [Anaerolineales bacterium]
MKSATLPADMDLPAVFINNVTQAFGEPGRRFLADLPELIAAAARRWNLTAIQAVPILSYNFAAFARQKTARGYAKDVVLKIGVPNHELTSEMAALRLYAGEGACRLYDSDPETGMLLEERLRPGTMLHQDGLSDEAQTAVAAQVMRRIWRPAPPDEPLITLESWFNELRNLRPRFGGGTGPFPPRLVESVEALLPDLFGETSERVLLHGDCHHYNILKSERGWLIIDPKGVVGPPGYEVGPLMLNPWDAFTRPPDAKEIAIRRLEVLSEVLGIEQDCLHAWAICHTLLSAWWDLSEDNTGGESTLACGESFLDLRKKRAGLGPAQNKRPPLR